VTTIAVVAKDGLACIAADSLTSLGEMKLPGVLTEDRRKILKVGDSYIGLSGSTSHYGVLESYFASAAHRPSFRTRKAVFETWRKLHSNLKEHYFLNPKDEDSDPYESSQITALLATPWGLYGVFTMREVFAYPRFWAMGSGREYALGALHTLYDRPGSAAEIAEAAVLAGCEFDKSSAAPVEKYVVTLRKR
jgi:ATP-dependent protease HslVU (ClpYQ) peptidase subunit